MTRARAITTLVHILLLTLVHASLARAQGLAPRQDVTFELTQPTAAGQSVFVLGNAPELGDNDIRYAVKLSPAAYPTWRATISLPVGRSCTYSFYTRNDGPGQTSQSTNGTLVSGPITLSIPDQPRTTISKAFWISWRTAAPPPTLYWRVKPSPGVAAPFTAHPVQPFGPAGADRPIDTRYLAWNFGRAGDTIEFYFSNGLTRDPIFGNYSTALDGAFIQGGQIYSYIPVGAPSPPTRDYSAAAVPTLFSPQLNESRGYRVFLPRGYAQHTWRSYPVLYMHDGQNVFEVGPFGSWNGATAVTNAQSFGAAREFIVVALDNGPNRLRDYLPPTDSLGGTGRGDAYLAYIRDTVKPFIDANYRTIPSDSGIMGSSMGAVISLYATWDFTSTFTRGGLLSGAWQTCPNYLARVRTTSMRPIRFWLDSGDSGTSSDNYWLTYNLRDHFIEAVPPKASLNAALAHAVGYGQKHNEAAWAARLPAALAFLYPAQQEPNELLRIVFGPHWDANADGQMTIDDLALASRTPRDLDLDGVANATDAARIAGFLRRNERAQMTANRP